MIADFLTKGMTGKQLQMQHMRAMWHGDNLKSEKSQLEAMERIKNNNGEK